MLEMRQVNKEKGKDDPIKNKQPYQTKFFIEKKLSTIKGGVSCIILTYISEHSTPQKEYL
jgi:hypothetical protein